MKNAVDVAEQQLNSLITDAALEMSGANGATTPMDPEEAMPKGPHVVTLEEALAEIHEEIGHAVDFVDSELAPNWEMAQKYFLGASSVEDVEGQSKAVATVLRNTLRAVKPSLMRIFMSGPAIVEYIPTARISSELAFQQTLFVNQLFHRAGGYRIMSDMVQNAGLKRFGVVKWWHQESVSPEYKKYTDLDAATYQAMASDPKNTILSAEQSEGEAFVDPQTGENVTLSTYDVELVRLKAKGEIKIASVPLAGFFISRNATCADDARVIGHAENRRKGDLVAMGIDYDLLDGLDAADPEMVRASSGEAEKRRKSQKASETPSIDPMMQEVLVTDMYARYDLDGIGVPQVYHFILGGTNHELLYYERVNRVQMCIVALDLEPNTFVGTSLYDVVGEDQDVQTSVLRGVINNLHMSNNRRLVYNDLLTNTKDVLDRKIGHPIRSRDPNGVGEIGVQPTVQTGLPFLQWLSDQTDNKVGVTKAASGLDPDALQSTDKQAVMNTIQLSQGQIELMARNIAETMIPLFRGLLELSIAHFDAEQSMTVNGAVIPVNQALYEPDLFMEPSVGIGTGSSTEKVQNLAIILEKQQGYLSAMGASNPFCNFYHVSNTHEDMGRAAGIYNIDRYFKPVTKEEGIAIEAQAAAAAKVAQEKADATPPPTVALLEAERIKAGATERAAQIRSMSEQLGKQIQAQLTALLEAAKDDRERDKMAQDLQVSLRQIAKQAEHDETVAAVQKEQKAPRDKDGNTP